MSYHSRYSWSSYAWIASLLLLASACATRGKLPPGIPRHATPRGSSLYYPPCPHNDVLLPYYGYHSTCWSRWPEDWVECPVTGPCEEELVPTPGEKLDAGEPGPDDDVSPPETDRFDQGKQPLPQPPPAESKEESPDANAEEESPPADGDKLKLSIDPEPPAAAEDEKTPLPQSPQDEPGNQEQPNAEPSRQDELSSANRRKNREPLEAKTPGRAADQARSSRRPSADPGRAGTTPEQRLRAQKPAAGRPLPFQSRLERLPPTHKPSPTSSKIAKTGLILAPRTPLVSHRSRTRPVLPAPEIEMGTLEPPRLPIHFQVLERTELQVRSETSSLPSDLEEREDLPESPARPDRRDRLRVGPAGIERRESSVMNIAAEDGRHADFSSSANAVTLPINIPAVVSVHGEGVLTMNDRKSSAPDASFSIVVGSELALATDCATIRGETASEQSAAARDRLVADDGVVSLAVGNEVSASAGDAEPEPKNVAGEQSVAVVVSDVLTGELSRKIPSGFVRLNPNSSFRYGTVGLASPPGSGRGDSGAEEANRQVSLSRSGLGLDREDDEAEEKQAARRTAPRH